MSIEDDLKAFWGTSAEEIILDDLKFKYQLGIGERAYKWLRVRENMKTVSEAVGVGTAAGAAMTTGAVAGVFATQTTMGSVLAYVGLGAAATTPIGWVVGVGALMGVTYAGVSKIFESSKDDGLVVIPKYINSPIDILAVSLIELILPIGLKLAAIDGHIDKLERDAILNHFVKVWGYNRLFVERMISAYELSLEDVSVAALVNDIMKYTQENDDCDYQKIKQTYINFMKAIANADGILDENEGRMIADLEQAFTRAEQIADEATVINKTTAAVNNAAKGFQDAVSRVGAMFNKLTEKESR